jgi:predicted RNase H-like HicB family nuclease
LKQNYLAVYEHRKDSFSGFVPDLPGCISTGTPLQEMQRNMSEAIDDHLDTLQKEGAEIPQQTTYRVEFPKNSEIEYWVVELIEPKVDASRFKRSRIVPAYARPKQKTPRD